MSNKSAKIHEFIAMKDDNENCRYCLGTIDNGLHDGSIEDNGYDSSPKKRPTTQGIMAEQNELNDRSVDYG